MIYKIKRYLLFIIFFAISFISYGDDPVPPPPPDCPGSNDPEVGAPIEDGVALIIGFALFYGAYKLQQVRKKIKETKDIV